MIYDKNNKYLRSFVINHKNTINTIYLVMFLSFCGGEQTFRENIHPPPVMCPREVFAKIARDFQMFVFYFEPKWYIREGFSFQMGQILSIFRLGLFYNEVLLDTVI